MSNHILQKAIWEDLKKKYLLAFKEYNYEVMLIAWQSLDKVLWKKKY